MTLRCPFEEHLKALCHLITYGSFGFNKYKLKTLIFLPNCVVLSETIKNFKICDIIY